MPRHLRCCGSGWPDWPARRPPRAGATPSLNHCSILFALRRVRLAAARLAMALGRRQARALPAGPPASARDATTGRSPRGRSGAAARFISQPDPHPLARRAGVVDDGDVCLLSEVKGKFKGAGVSRLSARESAVKAMQAHLYPKPKPKGEDVAALSKEFLQVSSHGVGRVCSGSART